MSVKCAQETGNGPLFYRARLVPGKFTGASRNATSGPIKFPDNGPDKLSGPEVTGTFEKQAPGPKTGPPKKQVQFLEPFRSQTDPSPLNTWTGSCWRIRHRVNTWTGSFWYFGAILKATTCILRMLNW